MHIRSHLPCMSTRCPACNRALIENIFNCIINLCYIFWKELYHLQRISSGVNCKSIYFFNVFFYICAFAISFAIKSQCTLCSFNWIYFKLYSPLAPKDNPPVSVICRLQQLTYFYLSQNSIALLKAVFFHFTHCTKISLSCQPSRFDFLPPLEETIFIFVQTLNCCISHFF